MLGIMLARVACGLFLAELVHAETVDITYIYPIASFLECHVCGS